MLHDARLTKLVSYASENIQTTVAEAHGRCFLTTLALGREAYRLGLCECVGFVRWHVCNDVNFLEHWALVVKDEHVIDLTAIQVDGNSDPFRCLAGYPANYIRPHQYPITDILDLMGGDVSATDYNYSRHMLWTLHKWMFLYDAKKAVRTHSILTLTETVAALVRHGITLCLGHLLELAIWRMTKLLTRLR